MSMETWAGEMIDTGTYQIVPFSRALRLKLPFGRNSNLVWNRPVSVLVTDRGGNERVLPVHDVTRIAQVAILLGTLGVILILRAFSRGTRR